MNQLKIRSSYSFRKAYGSFEDVIAACRPCSTIGLADDNTWGHVKFHAACRKAGIKPILGVQVAVAPAPLVEKERQNYNYMTLLARNAAGLSELYRLVSDAYDNFYYVPRLFVGRLEHLSNNIIILSGYSPAHLILPNLWLEASPGHGVWNARTAKYENIVATSDNHYPTVEDRAEYEAIAGDGRLDKTGIMHIASADEMRLHGVSDAAINNADRIAAMCEDYDLPKCPPMVMDGNDALYELAHMGLANRPFQGGLKYGERLDSELATINKMGFTDYFLMVADLMQWAKKTMLTGPARGSSAGSLVAYALGITDVDPMRHGLMFERFIDPTRKDPPDIDMDFPDSRREEVIKYLADGYGADRVAHLGTVSRYKQRLLLTDLGKLYRVPVGRVEALKKLIMVREPGDERFGNCIGDTFKTNAAAAQFLREYPAMRTAERLENHPRHTGKHASGIIVSPRPVSEYCAVDSKHGTVCLEGADAETLGILKLDVLGLRTLSVLDDCLKQINMGREYLLATDVNDPDALAVLNSGRLAGVFQFEGETVRSLAQKVRIDRFEDVCALTALARPGPLAGGGAAAWIDRKNGAVEPKKHPVFDKLTADTHGIVIYQEQVMLLAHEIGGFEWGEVNQLRRAMGKKKGADYFNGFFKRFAVGAGHAGMTTAAARSLWDEMLSFGTYAFNKSHAVAYSMLTMWCAVLKARHPLEYAKACLQSGLDEHAAKAILRELIADGRKITPFSRDGHPTNWTIGGGELVGPLTNVKGIGAKKAADIRVRLDNGIALTDAVERLLAAGTPYDDLFECETKWGGYYRDPKAHGVLSANVSHISAIQEPGRYVFIGRIIERKSAEYDGAATMNLTLEDDTGTIWASLNRWKLPKYKDEAAKSGWFLVRGDLLAGYRKIYIDKMKFLGA